MGVGDGTSIMAIGTALMLIVVLALFGGALWQYSMVRYRNEDR